MRILLTFNSLEVSIFLQVDRDFFIPSLICIANDKLLTECVNIHELYIMSICNFVANVKDKIGQRTVIFLIFDDVIKLFVGNM